MPLNDEDLNRMGRALKAAIRAIKTRDNPHSEWAFYLIRHNETYAVYIDRKPGKKFTRFQVPKLIHEHLKQSALASDGLGTPKDIRNTRCCAGVVKCQGETFYFQIQSKAGKAGPSDLNKALQKQHLKKHFPTYVIGSPDAGEDTVADPATVMQLVTQYPEPRNFQARYRDGSLSIEQMGNHIADINSALETATGRDKIALMKLLAQLNAFYNQVSEGNFATSADYTQWARELEDDIKSTSAKQERLEESVDELIEEMSSIEGSVENFSVFTAVLSELLGTDSALSQPFITEQLDKLTQVTGYPRLSRVLSAMLESRRLAVETNQTESCTLREELLGGLQLEAGQFYAEYAQAFVQADNGDKCVEIPFDLRGHLSTIAAFFRGGADAAKYASAFSKVAHELNGQPPKKESKHAREVQQVLNKYAHASKDGQSFVEGIKYLADAELLVSGELKFTAEAMGQLGPLAARVQSMLRVYSQAGGKMNFHATLGLLKGIDINASIEQGATVTVQSNVTGSVGVPDLVELELSMTGEAQGGARAHAKGIFTITRSGEVCIHGSVSAFAGTSSSTESVISLKDATGKQIFTLGTKLKVMLGVGVEMGGTFEFRQGKLKLSLNLGAALGVGFAGEASVQIDLATIQAMLDKLGRRILRALESKLRDLFKAHPLSGPAQAYEKNRAEYIGRVQQIVDALEQGSLNRLTPKVIEAILKNKYLRRDGTEWFSDDPDRLRRRIQETAHAIMLNPDMQATVQNAMKEEDLVQLQLIESFIGTVFTNVCQSVTDVGFSVTVAGDNISIDVSHLTPQGVVRNHG